MTKLISFLRDVLKICRSLPQTLLFCGGSWKILMQRVCAVYQKEGMRGVFHKARNIPIRPRAHEMKERAGQYYKSLLETDATFAPRVSIIVPCYNHAPYLRARLDSIYAQTYANTEVILLDDCSTDQSRAILSEYCDTFADKTVCVFNERNSGGVFRQWKKGLERATGDLVWIAESDDRCSLNFLSELVPFFANPGVMLGFARTDFIRGADEKTVWTSEEYLADIQAFDWQTPFVRTAHCFVQQGWNVKNIIPNASAALFRRQDFPLFEDENWLRLKMCGDWVFYLSIMRGGLVAFTPHAVNYYRQHDANTSVNTQKKDLYYQEHEAVATYLARLYSLKHEDIENQKQYLYARWRSENAHLPKEKFDSLYSIQKITPFLRQRKQNLAMVIYAFSTGGGEIFPIFLANLLKKRGYAVTLVNCNQKTTDPSIQAMLSKSIPILEMKDREYLSTIFYESGIEIIHSHHAWVDISIAMTMHEKSMTHIITMHGMYEMLSPEELQCIMHHLENNIDAIVYVAPKNISPFSADFCAAKKTRLIRNALPIWESTPASRAELGIQPEDFVFCLVSRAMPEKGWAEAIKSVQWANAQSDRKIHLLLIGDGEEADRLKTEQTSNFCHFLGFKNNPRDYFTMSDMGLLPTRFHGESNPLVVIECLLAGRPCLASNVGEIREMLQADDGMAGAVFDLDNWTINVQALGDTMFRIANNWELYAQMLSFVPHAAKKFSPDRMLDEYEEIYNACHKPS